MRNLIRIALPCAAMLILGCLFASASAPSKHVQRGMDCLRSGDAERAQYELLSINSRPQYEVQACLLRVWLSLRSSVSNQAALQNIAWDELRYAAEDREYQALALALMGQAAYEAERLSDALNFLEGSLKADPGEVEAHRWLGAIYYDIGLADQAMQELQYVARRERANAGVHHLMGLILRERGEYAAAAEAYRESLTRQPNRPEATETRIDLGGCLLKMHQYDEVLAAIADCPDSPEVLLMRADCYAGQGKINLAMETVDAVLALDAENPSALSVKAAILRAEGDVKTAIPLLAHAVALRPNDYALRYRLVSAYREAGEDRLADDAAVGMEDLRRRLDRYHALVERAGADAADAKLRYEIASLARELGMGETADNWLKAAHLLEHADLRPWLRANPTP
ncbi:MAG TPA: tetratricopeptide repeat protein [Pirellulales bacterium]|nr:tetratricopeptide repeat protein [Pirellulales bacterium]